jgi:hypothetical protein
VQAFREASAEQYTYSVEVFRLVGNHLDEEIETTFSDKYLEMLAGFNKLIADPRTTYAAIERGDWRGEVFDKDEVKYAGNVRQYVRDPDTVAYTAVASDGTIMFDGKLSELANAFNIDANEAVCAAFMAERGWILRRKV